MSGNPRWIYSGQREPRFTRLAAEVCTVSAKPGRERSGSDGGAGDSVRVPVAMLGRLVATFDGRRL